MKTTEAPVLIVKKGWGHEEIYWNQEYCGKKLVMLAGKKLSWHLHLLKDEVFAIFSGKVKLYYGDDDDMLKATQIDLVKGDTFHVYRGLRHRLEAYEDSEIIEFSTHHEDSDSIKIIKGD